MNADLAAIVRDRLKRDGLERKPWAPLVVTACRGREALEDLLTAGVVTEAETTPAAARPAAGTYLRSLSVEGFRGIGARQTIDFTPGPGLTLVVGRNGSGKSSFAEALEVLFTGDSKRWADRSKIWKEGWRNLHQPHPTTVEAVVLLEGEGPAKIVCGWDERAPLEARRVVVQPKGKPKTTIDALGWDRAVVSYRPFLSYNELGSMLDEGPSKLYDALSMVLGLEDLVTAQEALSKARLTRQKSLDAADAIREELVERLSTHLLGDGEAARRATAGRDALTSSTWGLDAIAQIVGGAGGTQPDQEISLLQRALSLDPGDPDRVAEVVAALRDADGRVKAIAGTDAESSRQTIALLSSALEFHASHGETDCPVCGSTSALTATWAEQTRIEIERLRRVAAAAETAHRAADQVRRSARELLGPPPQLLRQLAEVIGSLDGLDVAREQWVGWQEGAALPDLLAIAAHLETRHAPLVDAVEHLAASAAAAIQRREDRWRPFADALRAWLPQATAARAGATLIPQIKDAEDWLKQASGELRDARFAPIAKKAMAAWEHLRQHSNVQLGHIELTGSRTTRKVTLDVTVDGVRGAALGVMSQGELHSLALSLFLPRATLPDSPFRFVVIDDPVQSMDPARVDGLARALEETARTRQVIVFTHDDRLPEAIRRMGIAATILSVTRRQTSVVEVRKALDPVQAHIEDALALAHTADLPLPVVRRVVPGMCRLAIEAAIMRVMRRRRLAAGVTHAEVEEELAANARLTPLAALALFNDRERGSDITTGLANRFGRWAGEAFKACRDGAHQGVDGDVMGLIRDVEKLTTKLLELR